MEERNMKFFMSSEVDVEISEDFRILRNQIEFELKKLESNNYGDSIDELAIIPIVVNLTPEFEEAGFHKERVKYSKKNRDTDIRLRIDFHTFLNANTQMRKILIIQNIINSIRAMNLKVKKGFDGKALEEDILELFGLSPSDLLI